MSLLMNSQNQKQYYSLKHKKRLTQDQVRVLETSFNSNKKLEPERKLQLARELGIPPRQIAIWYQNKRARWKTQSLELDYGALQLRLETAVAEKRRLEREVEHLRGQLDKAHKVLLALKQPPTAPPPPPPPPPSVPTVSCTSSCCDEGGGSYTLHDHHQHQIHHLGCSWVNNFEALQLEELCSCSMAANR